VCIGWFLVGLGLALWVRARRPARYAELGRLVNRSLVIGEGEPVEAGTAPPGPGVLAER
jgi:hypothetical protein